MGLEAATYLDDLVVTNPAGTDPKSEGDNHLRLIKSTLKNTFPGMDAAATAAAISFLKGTPSAHTFTDLTVTGNTILGDASGDTLTINAGTWTLGNNYTATFAAGAIGAGVQSVLQNVLTFTGDAAGTSNGLCNIYATTASGANNLSGTSFYAYFAWAGTATCATGVGVHSDIRTTSTGGVTQGAAFQGAVSPIAGNTIATGYVYWASAPTVSGGGAITTLYGFRAENLGNASITTAVGVSIADFSGSTNMRGIQSSLSSGPGKYNLYIDGTADNYIAGALNVDGAVTLDGNVTLGDASGDTLTINAGTWTIGSTVTATRAIGAAAAGTTTPLNYTVTFTGGAGGSTAVHPFEVNATGSGSNAYTAIRAGRFLPTHAGSATATVVTALQGTVNASSTGNVTTAIGVYGDIRSQGANVITTGNIFQASAPIISGGGAITNLYGLNISNLGNASVTLAEGILISDFSGSSTMRAIHASLSSGAGKYNLYIDGTADNYLAGNTGVGNTPSSIYQLHVFRSATATAAADYALRGQINVSNASGTNNKIGISSYVQVNTPFGGTNVLYGVTTDFVLNYAATVASYIGLTTVTLNTLAAGTITSLVGASHPTQANAGGATVTTHTGFYVAPQTVGSTIYGLRSRIAAAAGRYNLYIDGTAQNYVAGRFHAGSDPNAAGHLRHRLDGSFTSDGGSTTMFGLYCAGALTGAAGDNVLVGGGFSSSITTGGGTTAVGQVAQVYISEPAITVTPGDTISVAASLYIANAPTEGTTNAALYVSSGNTILLGNVAVAGVTANYPLGVRVGTDQNFQVRSVSSVTTLQAANNADSASVALAFRASDFTWSNDSNTLATASGTGLFFNNVSGDGYAGFTYGADAYNSGVEILRWTGVSTNYYGMRMHSATDALSFLMAGSAAKGAHSWFTQFSIVHTASATTYIQASGATTGGSPYIRGAGETNTGLRLETSGSGSVAFYSAGGGTLTFTVGSAGLLSLTAGVSVSSYSLGTISSGTTTPDPQDRGFQHYTNNGAHTLAPSGNTGSIIVDITNGASAGAITTSGFTQVSGDAFTTTSGHKFRCSITIGNGGSLLAVTALQ